MDAVLAQKPEKSTYWIVSICLSWVIFISAIIYLPEMLGLFLVPRIFDIAGSVLATFIAAKHVAKKTFLSTIRVKKVSVWSACGHCILVFALYLPLISAKILGITSKNTQNIIDSMNTANGIFIAVYTLFIAVLIFFSFKYFLNKEMGKQATVNDDPSLLI